MTLYERRKYKMDSQPNFDDIVQVCLLYGKILQESNATSDMINANIHKIINHLNIENNELSTFNAETSFVIINRHDNTVKMIPVEKSGYNFEKILRVERVLDDFLANKMDTQSFLNELRVINQKNYSFPEKTRIISAALVCGGMNVIMNGLNWSFFTTFFLGIIGYWSYLKIKETTKINIFSILSYSTIICFFIVCLVKVHVVSEPYSILFSCIMPLLPGTTFVNAIRAMMDGDYLTGMIQSMDAFSTALMLGLPVAIIFSSVL